jgi:hypothetical protein
MLRKDLWLLFKSSWQLPGGQIAKRGSVIYLLSPDIEIAPQLPVANHLMLVRFTNSTSSLQTFEVPYGCPTWVCRGSRPVNVAFTLLLFILVVYFNIIRLQVKLCSLYCG